MKKNNALLIIVALLLSLTLLAGCSSSGIVRESIEASSENHITVATETETTKETEPPTMGDWTLEECKNTTGIFIAHEDGTFTQFYGGGYLEQDWSYNALGMFMRNDIFEHNPAIGKEDKLVLFCDSTYLLEMVPVNWQVGVLYHKLDDGTRCYTLAKKDSYGDIRCYTYYDNHETVENKVAYIDGTPIEDYPFEFVQGGTQNTTGCGFPKGSTVKLGVVNGSAIIEETYEASATYFDCNVMRDLYGASDDVHCLYPTPTTDGYAIIDIYDGWHDNEIPSGTYVLKLKMGSSYIAYLLNWENS